MLKTFSRIFLVFFLAAAGGLFSPVFAEDNSSQNKKLKENVVLIGTPIAVKPVEAWRTVDALEKLPDEMGSDWKVVVFRIEEVWKGEFRTVPFQAPLPLTPQGNAKKKGEFLDFFETNFRRSAVVTEAEKDTLSVAVTDPFALFGIKEGEPIPKQPYKISLAILSKSPLSYLMLKAEKSK